MSDYVEVPREGSMKDQAILLLAAAEDLGVDQGVVQIKQGRFHAPKDVVEKAFGSKSQAPDSGADEPPKKAAKKAAKKAPAKKSTSSKSQE